MQPTHLTYVPDFAQLFEANALLAQRRYSLGQKVVVNLVLFVAMALGGILSMIGGTVISILFLPQVPDWTITIALLALVALFYWKVMRPWQFRRSAAYVNATRKGALLQFTADESGLRWTDPDIDFRLNWSGIEAVYATRTSLCFMSGVLGLALPINAFRTEQDFRTFLADLMARLSPEAATKAKADNSLARWL